VKIATFAKPETVMQHIKRPTVKIISIFLTSLFLTSCNGQVSTVKDPTIDLNEGKLIYSISGEGTTSSWELEILFDQDNAVIKEKYARGAGRKYIYDKKSNEILGLIDDASSLGINKDNYFIYYTPEELVRQALSSNYGDTTIKVTQEFKDILGYKCQKSIIKHGNQVIVEVWLTDKIKPGIIYPWTPLTFDKIALEYEIKILGTTDRKYKIKSISDEKIDKKEFEHIVLDPYYLVIPAYVFSIDSLWTKDYEENKFQSFTYPYFKDGRESTIKFVKDELYQIVPKDKETDISIDFFVNKDGTISDIEIRINYHTDDKRIEKLGQLLQKECAKGTAKLITELTTPNN
jgi:hypothetical protein